MESGKSKVKGLRQSVLLARVLSWLADAAFSLYFHMTLE